MADEAKGLLGGIFNNSGAFLIFLILILLVLGIGVF